ncbi:MAG: GTP 3',8-cyclase MoaA [Desulfobacteraceae bacterium]|nr:GTP 3',8-cyclase MoaA [Desulfobacteraceae bacterium]
MVAPPTDSFKRKIDYLRLSITDRCNLRCTYCMPEHGVPKIDHADILRYEELVRLAEIVAGMGMSKIRITGGEPLVRKDVLTLCERISRIPGIRSLSITTNGVLLSDFARGLRDAGIKRINVSLDTLKPEKYALITRSDRFSRVWEGIMAAQEAGISPIKLNAVVMNGVNDDEIEDLAHLTFKYPFHVRFIEFMPFRQQPEFEGRLVPAPEILARLRRVAPLALADNGESNGPALHYRFEGALGKLGIISPVSDHFCPSCNRLRVTADGKLRTCLFSREETDLRLPLRQGNSEEEIADRIRSAISLKPEKHQLSDAVFRKCISRPMFSIGG